MIRAALLLTLSAVLACAQPSPQFEVVSVRATGAVSGRGRGDPGELRGCQGGPGTSDPGRWICNTNMGDLLFKAYPIMSFQLTPPDWAFQTLFEIAAKLPEGATREQMPPMIRGMLENRFKLAAHFVKKDLQVYEMTVGKDGPKFKEWADLTPWGEDRKRPPQPKAADFRPADDAPADWYFAGGRRAFRGKQSMNALAGRLSNWLNQPVIDATGLKGDFDIMLDFVADQPPIPGREPDPPAVGPTLMKAVESQLGLKLESKKTAIDVLMIDRLEKTPTDN